MAQQRALNICVHANVGEDDFAAWRTASDDLAPPVLMDPASRANVRAEELPPQVADAARPSCALFKRLRCELRVLESTNARNALASKGVE